MEKLKTGEVRIKNKTSRSQPIGTTKIVRAKAAQYLVPEWEVVESFGTEISKKKLEVVEVVANVEDEGEFINIDDIDEPSEAPQQKPKKKQNKKK